MKIVRLESENIKGIGPAKAESLESRLSQFWADHPEFCQTSESQGEQEQAAE